MWELQEEISMGMGAWADPVKLLGKKPM